MTGVQTYALPISVPHDDKELLWIQDANHYYFGQPEKAVETARSCADWLARHNL